MAYFCLWHEPLGSIKAEISRQAEVFKDDPFLLSWPALRNTQQQLVMFDKVYNLAKIMIHAYTFEYAASASTII